MRWQLALIGQWYTIIAYAKGSIREALFMQIAKLLVIPYVCLVERFFLGSRVSREVLGTILVVVLGVGIV